jgi:uncharacterized protein
MTTPAKHRTRISRQPKKARYDRESIDRVLERGLVAHVAFDEGKQPYCIPTLYARIGDRILIHGSTASRMIRLLAAGAPACVTVTLLDGLVLARSAFEHSANYESVVLLGRFQKIDDAEKGSALEAFTEALLPGRWREVRAPNRKELKATTVLGMRISEAVAKISTGGPDDDSSPDAARDVWAGVIPVRTSYGPPEPSPGLRPGIPVSPSVTRLLADTDPQESAAAPWQGIGG